MDRRDFLRTALALGVTSVVSMPFEAESKKAPDLETVTLHYKTIPGNDPENDERVAFASALREIAGYAGFLAGDNGLSIPEDAAIKLVKPENVSVTIDRNKIRRQRHTRVLSESKPKWDEQRQVYMFNRELTLDYPRYLVKNDPALTQIAQTVANGYSTLEEKAQALLCFVQTGIKYDFDSNRKADFLRDPRLTLLDQKGDCKDTSVLYVNLVQTIGIRPVFILYDGHVNVGVPIDLESHPLAGQAESLDGKVRFRGKTYYVAETTPEEPAYIGKIMVAQQGKKVDYILPA